MKRLIVVVLLLNVLCIAVIAPYGSAGPRRPEKVYHGTIESLAHCQLGEGDKRVCFDLVLKLANGSTKTGGVYPNTNIFLKNALVYSSNDAEAPNQAEMSWKSSTLLQKYLIPGRVADMYVQPCDSDENFVHTIRLLNGN